MDEKGYLLIENQLKEKLSILKKNKENVPLAELKTKYSKGYNKLCEEIKALASDYIILTIFINVHIQDELLTEIIDIVNETIGHSELLHDFSVAIYRNQNIGELKILIEELKKSILKVLQPICQIESFMYFNK